MTTPNPPADSSARRASATGRGEPAQGGHRRRGRASVQGGEEGDGRKRTAAPGRGDVHGRGGGRQREQQRKSWSPACLSSGPQSTQSILGCPWSGLRAGMALMTLQGRAFPPLLSLSPRVLSPGPTTSETPD